MTDCRKLSEVGRLFVEVIENCESLSPRLLLTDAADPVPNLDLEPTSVAGQAGFSERIVDMTDLPIHFRLFGNHRGSNVV